MKYDIITIGSATRDIFFQSKAIQEKELEGYATKRGACFPFESKLDIDVFLEETGGGAVNTAVTFAYQGLKTAVLASVGDDEAGRRIERELQEVGVSPEFLYQNKQKHTATSIVISVGKGGRAIFRHKGAAGSLQNSQISWNKLKAKWFYINHLRDEDALIVGEAVRRANEQGIKVAMNPGSTQLERKEELKGMLDGIDVFILNQEEAAFITDIPFEEKDRIFERLDDWVKGIVVMTRGPKGVEVSDGKIRWSAGILPMEDIADRTGAGDAFGSGFVASLMKTPDDIEAAMQLGSANATGALREWGAKNGLLKKTDSPLKWGALQIERKQLTAAV
ncbi:MAG: carbohydrate kinase family protein [Candidatus Yanofskybacteria bacterium]|nr:carbohydrate kinase family protein [Candidatus Yanofskybacteria bacterium]